MNMSSIVKAVVFLSSQGQAFYGHQKKGIGDMNVTMYDGDVIDGTDHTRGNFISLFQYSASFRKLLKKTFEAF